MTPEEKRRMDHLCRMIQAEQDPEKFVVLIRELNDFLEKRQAQKKVEIPQEKLR